MLREIVSKAPRQAELIAYEDRPINGDEARVRVRFASPKHGTEMHLFRNANLAVDDYYDETYHLFRPQENPGGSYYFCPGNMWVGEITEIGAQVDGFAVGDRVAGYGSFRDTQIARPGDLLKMPEGMTWQQAVCYDPCHFALSGVRDAYVRPGDSCLVTGLGAIGQMAAQIAKIAGAKFVAVSDPIADRRRIALENGADVAFDPTTQDVGFEMKKLTGTLGADAVVETSGTYQALEQSLRAVAYGGRIAVVGWYNPCRYAINLGREGHMNNATLFFSRACSEPNPDYPRWSFDRVKDECWAMLGKGLLRCDNIIQPIVPMNEAAEAYMHYVDQAPEESIKMGVSLL